MKIESFITNHGKRAICGVCNKYIELHSSAMRVIFERQVDFAICFHAYCLKETILGWAKAINQ